MSNVKYSTSQETVVDTRMLFVWYDVKNIAPRHRGCVYAFGNDLTEAVEEAVEGYITADKIKLINELDETPSMIYFANDFIQEGNA